MVFVCPILEFSPSSAAVRSVVSGDRRPSLALELLVHGGQMEFPDALHFQPMFPSANHTTEREKLLLVIEALINVTIENHKDSLARPERIKPAWANLYPATDLGCPTLRRCSEKRGPSTDDGIRQAITLTPPNSAG